MLDKNNLKEFLEKETKITFYILSLYFKANNFELIKDH